jgi:hypothetical protein
VFVEYDVIKCKLRLLWQLVEKLLDVAYEIRDRERCENVAMKMVSEWG